MGLFSWLKKTGAKESSSIDDHFSRASNETAKNHTDKEFEARLIDQKKIMLTGIVDSLGLDIENFDITYTSGEATVYGQVKSDQDKNMIISAIQSADGISSVDNRISVVASATQVHVVKRGDSLSKIAKIYYGDPMKYKQIFAANTDVLDDPNKIFPGQELKIPAIS